MGLGVGSWEDEDFVERIQIGCLAVRWDEIKDGEGYVNWK